MATTAAGTLYTVHTASVGGETVVWAVANAHTASADIPTVLYTHGAGGAADQFATLGAWKGLRDWLIDNGWAWIEGTGGGAQPWGNQASQDSYDAAFAYVDGILDIGPVVVLGRSMGGAVGARLYLDHRDTDARFVALIQNSGVQDLAWAYDYDSGRWTAAFNSAWGVANKTAFLAAVVGLNPISGPAASWAGAKVLQMWGDADTTVPPSANATPMRSMYTGQPAIDTFNVRVGGDHSATNGSYLEVAAMTAFLSEVTGGAPPEPEPPQFFRATGMFLSLGGERYEIIPS